MWERIALIGFSGTGKSTTAKHLAQALGWTAIDLDEALESRFEMSIPEIFARHGEAIFRDAERETLSRACAQNNVVIATGGGAPVSEDAWTAALLGNPRTLTVALDASPAVSLERLRRQQSHEGDAVQRPMLAAIDPLARIAELKQIRQPAYDRANITLPVDRTGAMDVAHEIGGLLRQSSAISAPDVVLNAPGGVSEIFVRPGVMNASGTLVREAFPGAKRAWVVTDEHVAPFHLDPVHASLASAGLGVETIVVPPGESSKTLDRMGHVLDSLLDGGIERSDVIVALGGGVIGDLAGFVAATVLRGVGLTQIPTTLLAMVDSSVGGKTGINHRTGKNLIGSFYQPSLVIVDPNALRTLAPRELRQGWAEIIKHAMIQPSTPGGERADLLPFLDRNGNRLRSLEEPVLSYLIRRNIALKGKVAEADERESGIRAYLNFGHTVGHAIEASDYRLLHGEAVALGMRAAVALSVAENRADPADAVRLGTLLDAFGLPDRASFDLDRSLERMRSDKKRVAGSQRWVLLRSGGGVELRSGIGDAEVRKALALVHKSQPPQLGQAAGESDEASPFLESTYLEKFRQYLEAANVDVPIIDCGTHTLTVEQAAKAVDCATDQILKTLLFQNAEGSMVVAIAAGAAKVDASKLVAVTDLGSARLVKPKLVLQRLGFPAGGVPPIGLPSDIPVVMDERAAQLGTCYAGAGTTRHLGKFDATEIRRLTGAVVADILMTENVSQSQP